MKDGWLPVMRGGIAITAWPVRKYTHLWMLLKGYLKGRAPHCLGGERPAGDRFGAWAPDRREYRPPGARRLSVVHQDLCIFQELFNPVGSLQTGQGLVDLVEQGSVALPDRNGRTELFRFPAAFQGEEILVGMGV